MSVATKWLAAAGAGALLAVVMSGVTRLVSPDTDTWTRVLAIGIPYGAALGLLARGWVLRFGVKRAEGSWLKRILFRAALIGVMFALFELFPLNVAVLVAPLALTLLALTLVSVIGHPAAG